LSSGRDLVEITKDIGAMMITGYIVVGADDHGLPTGDPARLELFDPATVHTKVAKYIPGRFDLRVSVHAHKGQSFAVIYVAPHPDGFYVFGQAGNYAEPGKAPGPRSAPGRSLPATARRASRGTSTISRSPRRGSRRTPTMAGAMRPRPWHLSAISPVGSGARACGWPLPSCRNTGLWLPPRPRRTPLSSS
jgi:hypothetical protein